MSQSSSEKSNTQNSSNSQSSIEIEIPTLKLDSQLSCLSQNIEPISIETTSTSQSEMITSTSVEKLTESLVEIDSELNVLSEKENESAPVILQPVSLETSSSQSETSTKLEILSESSKEIDTKKDLCDPSEVQKSESTLATLEPNSLATSSCRSETITITKSEIFSESPKESDTVKNLGGLAEEVEGESKPFTLHSILTTSSKSRSRKRTNSKKVVFSESLVERDIKKNVGGLSEGQESKSSMNSQPFSLGASSTSQNETMASTLIEKLTESIKQIDINKNAPSEVVLEGLAARLGEYLESIKMSLATSSTSKSEKRTNNEKEVLSESLKDINTEKNLDGPSEVQKSETSSMTSQPLSLAASTSQSETITNPQIEKLTESFKQIDINKEAPPEVLEGLAARLTLGAYLESKKNSLATSSISEREKRTNNERDVLSESLEEINTEKNLGGPSEVQKSESPMTSQPLSLAASSASQSETITNISIEKLTESLKQIDINKELETPSEGVAENLPASMNLNEYLESINIGAWISTSHFLRKRGPYLKKLVDEAAKLQNFMETVNKLRHEFQPCQHTSLSCVTMIPEAWYKFTKDWEVFMRQIAGIIETTTVIMQQCEENSTILREEFGSYLYHLLAISEDLGELEEICNHALEIYRPFCYNYDNYYFLLHISTMTAYLQPLQERVTQECEKFSSFEQEIGGQIKQAEEQMDDL